MTSLIVVKLEMPACFISFTLMSPGSLLPRLIRETSTRLASWLHWQWQLGCLYWV